MLFNTFKLATRSVKSNGFVPSFLKNTSSRLYSSSTKSLNSSNSNITTKLGLFLGASSALVLHTHSKILNEAANLGTINVNTPNFNSNQLPKIPDPNSLKHPRHSRFNGQLHYRQLSYGSLVGLFFGVVIGKLSSVLVFISLSAILSLQFLQSRGIIHVPWTSVVKVGKDRIDVRQLVLEDPSFKISFALSFLIAAFNI
ncbi:hypothetical protein BN7_78 [Wickerhamomyces ciferrii]|uniref:Uncharacterized protein n=1 Tax=Wickerhamomyces ciferrii (strain ATCC 14091 / BCRC 22168 / CBS 111 / JCM 3599 / NBRC 0793 / NRRL Y-1031 F-60-10) TaxID=1206466 RepID=K0K6I3_WICCF|nr:uncharacterized protein BN7_78 [Wickerhamomyces ciferrii]CCH40545.1 hypothetical protein BN7_78 [Wickerhamomyces ciferrii]